MAAYFRRRTGTYSGGALADDSYPALLVSGSAAAGAGETGDLGPSAAGVVGRDLENVYEFSSAAPDYESRDDDVIDCCPRHYQMALVDAQRMQPTLETFRPGAEATTGAVLSECCPLMSGHQQYGAAAAAVLRLHDRRRSLLAVQISTNYLQ